MKKFLFIVFIFCFQQSFSQSYTLYGFVKDSSTGEPLPGVIISINKSISTITNDYGYYSITTKTGINTLHAYYVGYSQFETTISTAQNQNIIILLNKSAQEIGAVEVVADYSQQAVYCKKMPIRELMQTPTVFGEPDVIKVLQQKAGIKNIGDGASGMIVRGGKSDQNNMLIDESNIYITSHLYGMVSVCNPLILKDVNFYNSYIPVEYGGRISSVVDMKLRDGNYKNYTSDVVISTLSANFGVEGPITKDKSSFSITGRQSTLQEIFKYSNGNLYVPNFHDFTAKTSLQINQKNKIYISGMYGFDNNSRHPRNYVNQQSYSTGIRWMYTPNAKIYTNTSLYYNNFTGNFTQDSIKKIDGTFDKISWNNGLREIHFKSKLNWNISSFHTIVAGIESKIQEINPGISNKTSYSLSQVNVLDNSIFAEDKFIITSKIQGFIGFRVTNYSNFGKAFWYSPNLDYSKNIYNEKKSGVWNPTYSFEPRCQLRYNLLQSVFSISYMRNSQPMQIITNNALSYSQIETWFPYLPTLAPLFAHQYTAGYSYSNSKYSFLSEIYYKDIFNQIDYIDHAQLFGNPYVFSEIRTGKSQAYGLESTLAKKTGVFKYQVNYTYSKVFNIISGITNTTKYVSNYDIPHDLKLQCSYELHKKFIFGLFWTFASGHPITVPIGFYEMKFTDTQIIQVPIYSNRNEVRLPYYHRLDGSFQYKFVPRKHIEQSLTLTMFNMYNKSNPLSYTYTSSTTISVYQFFAFFPSISYKAHIK